MKRMFKRQVALVATALTLGSAVANTDVSIVGAGGLSFEKTTTTQGEAISGVRFGRRNVCGCVEQNVL